MNCNICNQKLDNLRYQIQKNNTKHLVGDCPTHKLRFLHFIPNLNIPEYETKEKKYPQLSLI